MRMHPAVTTLFTVLCCVLGYAGELRAQDADSKKCGVPVSVGPGKQSIGPPNWFNKPILGYNDGTCLLFWNDQQADNDTSYLVRDAVYMQHVRADGYFQLPKGGVELTATVRKRAASRLSFLPVAAAQDVIGVFAHDGDSVWKAERFDSRGVRIWELERPLQGFFSHNSLLGACSDGHDGVISVLMRPGLNVDRVDPGGKHGWGSNGFSIPTNTKGNSSYLLAIESDGRGGVYLMYYDNNSPGGGGEWLQPDTWLQRVSSDGMHWFPTGRLMCRWVETFGECMSTDNNGNIVALATEQPHRNRLRLQKFSPAGTRLWDTAGVILYQSSHVNHFSAMIPDGTGGHFIAWYEYTGTNGDPIQPTYLRMQRINESGRNLWGADGIQIATTWLNHWFRAPQLVSDQHGGVIVIWYTGNARKDSVVHESDIYMQRLDGNGSRVWGAEGRPLCEAEGDQEPVFAVSDARGGAHVLWGDGYEGKNEWDVYYAHVTGDGLVSAAEATSPQSLGGHIEIAPSVVQGSARITIATKPGERVKVSVYDLLGREAAVLFEGEMAQTQRSFIFSGEEYGIGQYRLVLHAGTQSEILSFMILR